MLMYFHDDVIRWKHFPCYWPFVLWLRTLKNKISPSDTRNSVFFWFERYFLFYGRHYMRSVGRRHDQPTPRKNGIYSIFYLILGSSVSFSAGIQSDGDSVPETLGSNPALSRERQPVSFRFENSLPVSEHRNEQQQTYIYILANSCW